MQKLTSLLPAALVVGTALILSRATANGAPQTSFESLNACQRVPSIAVAAALSGRPIDAYHHERGHARAFFEPADGGGVRVIRRRQ